MYAAFTDRPLVRRFATVSTVVLSFLFFAIPAVAHGAGGATTRADLAGPAGYCQYFSAAPGRPVGDVEISTAPATSAGFHPVDVRIKIHGRQLPRGSYQVWLVNLYRDDAGQVVGCAASPFANPMTVKSDGAVSFHGSVDRYSGGYELQVYVGPIWGPGYGTSPATIDVP